MGARATPGNGDATVFDKIPKNGRRRTTDLIAWLEDLAAADGIEPSETTTRRYLKSLERWHLAPLPREVLPVRLEGSGHPRDHPEDPPKADPNRRQNGKARKISECRSGECDSRSGNGRLGHHAAYLRCTSANGCWVLNSGLDQRPDAASSGPPGIEDLCVKRRKIVYSMCISSHRKCTTAHGV